MRTISIIDMNNEEVILNPEKIIGITSDKYSDGGKDYPIWNIWMDGISRIRVLQSLYDIKDIRMAIEVISIQEVPQRDSSKPDIESKEVREEEPGFEYPNTVKRYDFRYKQRKNYYYEAQDWVYSHDEDDEGDNRNPCYYMDGNPLKATAMRIHPDMAKLLLSTTEYDFGNNPRNLSWIEIDGHTALLFNNRAKS